MVLCKPQNLLSSGGRFCQDSSITFFTGLKGVISPEVMDHMQHTQITHRLPQIIKHYAKYQIHHHQKHCSKCSIHYLKYQYPHPPPAPQTGWVAKGGYPELDIWEKKEWKDSVNSFMKFVVIFSNVFSSFVYSNKFWEFGIYPACISWTNLGPWWIPARMFSNQLWGQSKGYVPVQPLAPLL